MTTALDFLQRGDLTTKDKLVLLTANVSNTDDVHTLGTILGMSTNSVRQSMEKALTAEELESRELSRAESITEALMTVCGMDRNSMRSKDWAHLAKVTKELMDAGADGVEVIQRGRRLPNRLQLPVTPGSIEKYWPMLAGRGATTPAEVFK